MKRNQGKNGLIIEENIVLTEAVPSQYSIMAYILEAVMILFLCLSIMYCFLSGMQIDMDVFRLNVRVVVYVVILYLMFLYKPYLKYTLPAVLLISLLMGYMSWESIQVSFARTVNCIIDLYNVYFKGNLERLPVNVFVEPSDNNEFIYYVSFLLTGVLCYILLYAKNHIFYLIITIPLVFSPLIVGHIPNIIPYIGYIAGTIGVLGAIIWEKHKGRGVKVSKSLHEAQVVRVNRSKVAVQYISTATVLLVVLLAYFVYSPAKYETEFEPAEIRSVVKNKFDDVMSGDLFKDTILGKVFKSKKASGGLSKGVLNQVGEIKFKHETALKVKLVKEDNPQACYLRGYIGEQYNNNSWEELSDEDAEKLRKIEEGFTLAYNAESLSSAMVNLMLNSPYKLNDYSVQSVEIENVNADSSVDYLPYNMQDDVVSEDGLLEGNGNRHSYLDFIVRTEGDSPMSHLYRNVNIMNILKLNLINSAIYERYYNVAMKEDWKDYIPTFQEGELDTQLVATEKEHRPDLQNKLIIPVSDVYNGDAMLGSYLPLYLDQDAYAGDFGDIIAEFNEYGIEENAYFNYAREVYTKLPQEGLERVKQLVAGHEVHINPTVLNGENYSSIEQLGGIGSVEKSFQNKSVFRTEVERLKAPVEDVNSIQASYYEAIEFVRNYLAQNTSYSLKPGRAPSGEDYVEYFLFKNKKGFCVHYATAATVMLRAMGVPARYVEGYVITSSDYVGAKTVGVQNYQQNINGYGLSSQQGTEVELNIEDTNAHAWVEVYLPGLGWQPVEMTAPYIYESNIEIPPVNNDPTATLKPTPTPKVTVKPTLKPTVSPKATAKVTPTVSPKVNNSTKANNQKGFFGGIKSWYDKLGDTARNLINALIILLLLGILCLVYIYIRYFIGKRLRARKRHHLSNSQWVLYENQRFDKVLNHFKLTYYSSEPYEEFVARLKEVFGFVEESQARAYYENLLKARFSQEQLTEKDVLECNRFYNTYIAGLMKKVGKPKSWIYKKRWIL